MDLFNSNSSTNDDNVNESSPLLATAAAVQSCFDDEDGPQRTNVIEEDPYTINDDDDDNNNSSSSNDDNEDDNLISTIIDAVQEVVQDVQEAVQEEYQEVREIFIDELHDRDDVLEEEDDPVDEKGGYIMDMGMARNLGLLPGDAATAAALFDPNPNQAAACSINVPFVPLHSSPPLESPTNSSSSSSNMMGSSCQIFPTGGMVQVLQPIEAPTANDDDDENDQDDDDDEEEKLSYQSVAPTESEASTRQSDDDDKMNIKHEEEEDDHASSSPPIHAYGILIFAIVCLSLTGPFFNVQAGVEAEMKIFWRTSCTNCILLPLAIRGLYQEGWPSLAISHWCMVFLAGFSYSMLGIFFVLSLDYTSIGNAMVLNNSQAILLMVGKFFVGERVTHSEALGAFIAFSGAVLCSMDAAQAEPGTHGAASIAVMDEDDSSSRGTWRTLMGDGFALLSAFGGVGYLVFAQTVRPHLNLYMFMFFNMFQNSLYALLYIVASGQTYTIDLDPYTGLFGWLNFRPDRLPTDVVAVLLCNFFGVMGYIRMMHYFDKLIISVAGLMEPVVATLLAYGMGVGMLPGSLGWIGMALVTGGTFSVISQTTSSSKDDDDPPKKPKTLEV